MPDQPEDTQEKRDDEGLKQPADAVKDLDADEENVAGGAGGKEVDTAVPRDFKY
jgi:hypothetical protein